MYRARTIIESLAVSTELERAAVRYRRIEKWWEGWKWRLARDPRRDAFPIPGTKPQQYLIKTVDFSNWGAPASSTFLYTFDDNEVQIYGS